MLSTLVFTLATVAPTTPIYSITSAYSNLSLDVPNGSMSPGTPLQQWNWWGGNMQRWLLTPGGNGTYGIVNFNSGLAVDVPNGAAQNGLGMQQWTWWNGPMQNWQMQPAGDGSFYFVNSATGLCLEVRDYSTTAGGAIQQWNCVQQVQQRWKVVQVGDTGNGFVQSSGGKLTRNGKNLNLLGYAGSLPGLPWCGWTAQQLEDSLTEMSAHSGANVIRLWFMQAAGGPGNWGNFDAAIAAAKRHNVMIIPTLVNQWGDCEPANAAGGKNYKTLGWYQGGYRGTGDGYPLSFHDYAIAVAQRYAQEPTVAFWQLVNEAEARDPTTGGCPDHVASANALRAFADDMANSLHQVDRQHLVNLGTGAGDAWTCGVAGDDYNFVHAGAVDLCEVHSYDPGNVALPSIIGGHMLGCQALRKPVFIGELGICRNVQGDGSCQGNTTGQTLNTRAQFFSAKWRAAANIGASGVLVWDWDAAGADATFGVQAGDPIEAQMSSFASP